MRHNIYYHKVNSFFFAFLYASFLTSLPLLEFGDRANYLLYTENSLLHLIGYYNAGVVKLLTNEPLWLLFNISLGYFIGPESALRAIIFIPALIVPYVLLIKNHKYSFYVVLILLFPSVIKNHIIHLRQGVAIAVFVLGYFGGFKSLIKHLLLISTLFIHSSFYFVIFFYYVILMIEDKPLGLDLKLCLVFLFSITVGLSISLLVEYTGARQVGRLDIASGGGSGFSFIFWSLILFFIVGTKEVVC